MSVFSRFKTWFPGGKREVSVSDHKIGDKLGLGTSKSHSGERVTESSSLTIDTVWACVRILSQTIATLPLHLYRTESNGFGTVDREAPLYRILTGKPNFNMTAVRLWGAATAHMALNGNYYARKFRNKHGEITSIIPFTYQRMIGVEETKAGQLVYTDSSTGEIFSSDDIFHLRGFSLDGKVGLSVIKFARQSIGNALAINKTTGRVFGNGLQARGLITSEMKLTDEQVKQVHQRLEEHRNRSKNDILVLPSPLKYTGLSLDPDDAQMLESRSFTVEEICRWFGVPPMLIGHMTKNTSWGSGIEQINLFFLQYGLRTYLRNIESEIDESLIAPQNRSKNYAKFNIEGLLRGDSKGRAEYLRSMVNGTMMTPNEGRSKEDLAPIEGGDELLVNTSYVPLSQLADMVSSRLVPQKTEEVNTHEA